MPFLTDFKLILICLEVLSPYISIFKTHVDLVKDFDSSTVQGLQALIEEHNFPFFEDLNIDAISRRPRTAEWAHFVNSSISAGEGTIEGLREVGQYSDLKGQCGLLLLAEMSTKGSLVTGSALILHGNYSNFVLGFVANRQLDTSREGHAVDFLTFAIGINRATGGDSLGQQYQTPEEAIRRGSDIIIVGRGI
ncbi:MAG: orotidine 5'-phosphate decarboxylase [Geoglossum simile]|nr:MAG: orotidine 5'-phosphate decarboxylase [Geoglossum simile]